MTCPACNLPLAPGAYCAGNGTHPPRRARRLTGDERRAAQREAETWREAERTHAALVAVARPVVESAQQRRYLYRCGDLAGELAEAVKVGLITSEGAAELEARTAREVEAIDAEKERRRVAWEAKEAATAAHVEAHGHCEECDSATPTECHRWPLEAQAGHRCQCLCHPRPERARGEVFSGSGVGPQADWRWITDGAYYYSGQPWEYPAKAGQIVRGVRPVLGEVERLDPPEPRRRTSHRSAIATVALVGALMGVGGLTGEKP